MTRLIALVDDYKDRHGQPSDASIARAIGIAPQTVNSWRKRGLRELPDPEPLRALARLMNVDYETVVLRAVLVDIGVLDEREPTAAPGNRGAAGA